MAKQDPDRIDAKDTVEAAVDLPGVPEGTRGRVTMVTGLTWTRFRVQFENGHDLGQIDGAQLRKIA